MEIQITDYNNAQSLFIDSFSSEWQEINTGVDRTVIHLKASDQRGLVGTPIFDPVGTNRTLKEEFTNSEWNDNLTIPNEFRFLGTDVDFEKNGIIVEVQFSNYPFLLNNILRSELFFKANTVFDSQPVRSLILITKAGKFPSSNSTLYYEQAKLQLDSFSRYQLFSLPVRLVGLFPEVGVSNRVKWTEYDNPRYSRTIVEETYQDRVVNSVGKRYVFSDPT